jgi:hypothetical protein
MIASSEDARLLFHKWQHDAPLLRIRLMSAWLIFDGAGVVLEFSPDTLKLGGDSWEFTVPLAEASFTFSDPHEASRASVRAAESARYEFGLSVDLPDGNRLVLLERKASEEPE